MLIEVLVSIGAVVLLGGTTTVVAGRVAYKRLRRSRALALTALRTRAAFSLGSRRRVLTMRVRLAESVMSAHAALDLAAASAAPSGELPSLLTRIETEAVVVDDQLRLLESETDRRALKTSLTAVSVRVDQVCRMVGSLRDGVADGLSLVNDGTLASLGAEVDREVAALAAGAEQLRTLGGSPRSSGAPRPRDARTPRDPISPYDPTHRTSTPGARR